MEVTPENRSLPVSDHFPLGDFLTKDQPAVWPKYLLLDAGLVEKLELVIDELERYHVGHLAIMSGFRTPRYNQAGAKRVGAIIDQTFDGGGGDTIAAFDRASSETTTVPGRCAATTLGAD